MLVIKVKSVYRCADIHEYPGSSIVNCLDGEAYIDVLCF